MIIATGKLNQTTLANQVALVTGAGGGIGYEACRSLLWLGAKIIVAEINKTNGLESVRKLKAEFGPDSAFFVHTDVGEERSIAKLKQQALRHYGKVDIVINNATIASLGAVKDVSIQVWDQSYRVNLRGPVLLAHTFLPGMLERQYGVFVCVSSLGTAYMGALRSHESRPGASRLHPGCRIGKFRGVRLHHWAGFLSPPTRRFPPSPN